MGYNKYERLDHDPVKEYQQVIKSAVKQMIQANELPASAKNLILQTPSTSRFYLLPKIHKENNPGRPIVSACNCPTENIASYLDMVMPPLVCNLETYVKDTNHALQIFRTFQFDNDDTSQRLGTAAFETLYNVDEELQKAGASPEWIINIKERLKQGKKSENRL